MTYSCTAKRPGRVVYVLRSFTDPNRHYTGSTTNLKAPLYDHNRGAVRATRSLRPWQLVVTLYLPNPDTARHFERYLKLWQSLRLRIRKREADRLLVGALRTDPSASVREAALESLIERHGNGWSKPMNPPLSAVLAEAARTDSADAIRKRAAAFAQKIR